MKSRIISLSFSVLGGNKAGLGGIGCRLSPYIHFFLFGCCSIPSFVRISCSFRDETERLKQLFRDSQQLFLRLFIDWSCVVPTADVLFKFIYK